MFTMVTFLAWDIHHAIHECREQVSISIWDGTVKATMPSAPICYLAGGLLNDIEVF
jgi:hypothetical protein